MRNFLRTKIWIFLIAGSVVLLIGGGLLLWWRSRPPKPYLSAVTVAGTGLRIEKGRIPDYFGVAVDADHQVYYTDGSRGALWNRDEKGNQRIVTEQMDMPSGIAIAPDGSLIVADTGDHRILRVSPAAGQISPIAGAAGSSGEADGPAGQAKFNGPIGVAVSKNGLIYVADTYNDRIREISPNGQVRTIAGGLQGFQDGVGAEARFDTPCGIAIDTDGSLLIADTANHRIRRVTIDGQVSTLAGTGERGRRDGPLPDVAFDEPMAIAVRRDGQVFIADAGSSTLRMINRDPESAPQPVLTTLAGEYGFGLEDTELAKARLHRPTGIAFGVKDALIFADNGNGLIRALRSQDLSLGRIAGSGEAIVAAQEIRQAIPPRWPFDPPAAKRDVAGTFGEIRGEMLPEHDSWFHNGLDIAGAFGEAARAIYAERVTRPLAVEGAGTGRERLRLPLVGYIHVSIGRDRNDQPIGSFPPGAITFRRDDTGAISGVRVRRGTRFNPGDPIGTLNRLNHVHLIAGPAGSEINALAALGFPGLVDTIAPTIEGIVLINDRNEILFDSSAPGGKKAAPPTLAGKIRILARAFDQADGNPKYRRLGAYRLGYELLAQNGSPVIRLQENLSFDRLPNDPGAVAMVYAGGSQSGYEGVTIFNYVVTNTLREGKPGEGFLDLSALPAGGYILRVFADDYFGNRSWREVPMRLAN